MRIVIDIDEELYNYMQTEEYNEHLDKRFDYQIRFSIKNGTPLPKGATNGDVMKMIFGAEEIIINSFTDQIVVRMSDKYDRRFDLGWWNTPYKADKESD